MWLILLVYRWLKTGECWECSKDLHCAACYFYSIGSICCRFLVCNLLYKNPQHLDRVKILWIWNNKLATSCMISWIYCTVEFEPMPSAVYHVMISTTAHGELHATAHSCLPRLQTKYGEWAFLYSGPSGKKLPHSIHTSTSLNVLDWNWKHACLEKLLVIIISILILMCDSVMHQQPTLL